MNKVGIFGTNQSAAAEREASEREVAAKRLDDAKRATSSPAAQRELRSAKDAASAVDKKYKR